MGMHRDIINKVAIIIVLLLHPVLGFSQDSSCCVKEQESFLSSDSVFCPFPNGRKLTEIRGKLYQGNEPMEGLAACIDVKYRHKTATVRLNPLTNSFVMSVPRKAKLVFKVLGHESKVMRVRDIKGDSIIWERPPLDNNLYIVFGKSKT